MHASRACLPRSDGFLQRGACPVCASSRVFLLCSPPHTCAGDPRAALVPFLAHRVFGGQGKGRGYKWLLYGDDDTVSVRVAAGPTLSHLQTLHNDLGKRGLQGKYMLMGGHEFPLQHYQPLL
jgi:hypothetical protein